jgi:hypothetical protein
MAITLLPTPPQRSDPVNFATRADAFLTAIPVFAVEANTLATDVSSKQVATAASATAAASSQTAANNSQIAADASATAAAASSSATVWVSGTTYPLGNVRFSPINFLSYRRKVAGSGTTDPSNDPTNWAPLTAGDGTSTGTGSVVLSSSPTLTAPALGTPVSVVLTNATGLPLSTGVVGTLAVLKGGTGVTTLTGSGSVVLNTSPSLVTPVVDSLNGGQLAGMRNRIINGDMRISQRGNSFASGTTQYTLDRWQFFRGSNAAGATCLYTNTTIAGSISNYAQVQRNSGDTNTNAIIFSSSLETINIRDLAGKTITLSFYGYCSGNAVGNTSGIIYYGTGTDGNLASGFTGSTIAGINTVTGNSTWAKNTLTVTLPSNATQLGISFQFNPTGTAGANDFFGVSYVQLELGTVATPFEQRPIGLELGLCQRYYEVITNDVVGYAAAAGINAGSRTKFSVAKRSTPTITQLSNNSSLTQANVSSTTSNYIGVTVEGVTHFRNATAANANTQYSETASASAEL